MDEMHSLPTWTELPSIALKPPRDVADDGADAWEEWFWAICVANSDCLWAMELNADGELELMPPPSPPSDEHEGELYFALQSWNVSRGRPGVATGATGSYRLRNGAIRMPDAAWTPAPDVARPTAAPPRARPYPPTFVAEIRSRSDRLAPLLAKMGEYMANGSRLGWLIDPLERTVRIYRADAVEPELRDNPRVLDGEDVLTGFAFEVRRLIFDLDV